MISEKPILPRHRGSVAGALAIKHKMQKASLAALHTTSRMGVRATKNYNIMDCFGRPLPNAVRKTATVGSCPVRPTAARHSPICHRVLSARLRPVLRRGASRCRFARRACWPVRPHFPMRRHAVCNAASERQNSQRQPARKTKGRPPSWRPRQRCFLSHQITNAKNIYTLKTQPFKRYNPIWYFSSESYFK